MRLALMIVTALLLATPGQAQVTSVPDDQFSPRVQKDLDLASRASNLTAAEQRVTERVAGAWVYLTLCKGDRMSLGQSDWFASLRMVESSRPDDRLGSATLFMIAILAREFFGRAPPDLCRFAQERARQPIP